jgi:protein-disulfide isomerase/uncharacterized membrane protein
MATQTSEPTSSRARPSSSAHGDPPAYASWLLAAAALGGIVLASVSTYVHHQVTSGSGYTSFCNVNATVNCDTVVSSPYGTLLRIPVSVWAIGFYMVLFGLALRTTAAPSSERDQARSDAFFWSVAGTLFSAYLASVSAFVLKTICLLCGGLYVVSLLSLVAAWLVASPVGEALAGLQNRWNSVRRHPALSMTAVGAIVCVLGASTWLGAETRLTRDQIFKSNPQFYEWYTNQTVIDTPITGGHARGPEKAPIELVEFSDFECPHCAQAYVTLKDLLSRYKTQIRFVAHSYPLSSDCNAAMQQKGHEHACQAAVAAECAAKGGQFETYSGLLFANQGQLDEKSLKGYAKQAGLESKAFDTCLASPEALELVKEDAKLGERLGIRSTPTFFLNGRKIEGNLTYQNWLSAFAIELDKS